MINSMRKLLTWFGGGGAVIGSYTFIFSVGGVVGTRSDCENFSLSSVPVALADGSPLYVEPSAVLWSGGQLFVAGSPSYVWARGNHSKIESRNTLFGALIALDGTATPIPSPLKSDHLGDVRAVSLGSGLWAATFADVAPGTQFSPIAWPAVNGYWFGITDGTKWITLEEIRVPDGKLQTAFASRLILSRGNYSVALPLDLEGGRRVAAVFSRRSNGWTRHDRRFNFVNYVSLDTTALGNLLLGVVGSDTSDLRLSNQIVFDTLSTQSWTWLPFGRVDRESFNTIHRLDLGWVGDSLNATWLESSLAAGKMEARTILHLPHSADSRRIRLSDNALQAVRLDASPKATWIIHERPSSAVKTLSLVWTLEGTLERTQVASPYEGVIGAVWAGDKILIAGPVRKRRDEEPTVRLQLTSLKSNCIHLFHQ
jgi:hypothetical protein